MDKQITYEDLNEKFEELRLLFRLPDIMTEELADKLPEEFIEVIKDGDS